MATIKEWEDRLAELSPETLADMKGHLRGLKNIPVFQKHFKDTGIFTLLPIIDFVLSSKVH